MKTQNKFFIVTGCLMLIWFILPVDSFASSIYAKSSQSTVKINDEFKVDVYLDTETSSVNAVEGEFFYNKDTLEVKDVFTGNSVVTFWIDSPSISNLTNTGSTTFAGIIPGGYRNSTGYLYSVIFKAKLSGQAEVLLQGLNVIQNTQDAKVESLSDSKLRVIVSDSKGEATITLPVDFDKPEMFQPVISKSVGSFDDKYFITFVTQDKGNGIDHYEIKEGLFDKYKRVSSPYVLDNQSADSIVYIMAVDKNGNQRVVSTQGINWVPWYKNPWIVILCLVLVIFFGRFLSGRK